MTKNNVNIELLDRFMRNETSPEEKQLLLEWFRSSSSRNEILEFYQQRWIEASEDELPAEIQGRMYLRIKERMLEIENSHREEERKIFKLRSSFSRFLPYVATILLCIGISFSSYLYTQKDLPITSEYIVSAEKGQRASVTLPDGTKVWLNSHTVLRYKNDYGVKERNVFLNGEAYFEVSKDKEHRFVVDAGEMEVEALGTSFNVKAYREDKSIVATLYNGSIQATGGEHSIILLPDQQVLFNRENRQLKVERPDNIAYSRMWRDNELSFKGETLYDIAIRLNRIYNVQVEFKSEKIKQYRFSGVIKNNSLDNVIEIISLTAPILYEAKEDTIILSEKR